MLNTDYHSSRGPVSYPSTDLVVGEDSKNMEPQHQEQTPDTHESWQPHLQQMCHAQDLKDGRKHH